MSHRRFLVCVFLFWLLCILCASVEADAVENIGENLSMQVSDIILFITACSLVVVAAFEVRIAIMLGFLLFASEFILFTLATQTGVPDFDPERSAVAMMTCFVLLALSLFFSYKKASTSSGVA